MILRLLLLFTVLPALEIFLLLQIGVLLGPTQTFLLIVVTGTIGAWLAKQEGIGVLREIQQELARGVPPGVRLMEGAMVLAGGLLLITPGVVTDLAGFALIMPFTRRALAPIFTRWLVGQIDWSQVRIQVGSQHTRTVRTQTRPPDDDPPFDHPVA